MVVWNQVRDSLVTTQSCAPEEEKTAKKARKVWGKENSFPVELNSFCQAGFVLLEEVSFFFPASDYFQPLLFFPFFSPLNSFKHFLDFHQGVMWSPSPVLEETLNWDFQTKSVNCTSQQQKPLTWTHPLNNEPLPSIRCWRRGSPDWTFPFTLKEEAHAIFQWIFLVTRKQAVNRQQPKE